MNDTLSELQKVHEALEKAWATCGTGYYITQSEKDEARAIIDKLQAVCMDGRRRVIPRIQTYPLDAPPTATKGTEQQGGSLDMNCKCPRCGTSPFQHWNCGWMHKCHVCKTIWKQAP